MTPATDSRPIEQTPGLGPVSAAWLREGEITTEAEFRAVGAVEAYRRVLSLGVHPTFDLLWMFEAALRDIHWTTLPQADRDALLEELKATPPKGDAEAESDSPRDA